MILNKRHHLHPFNPGSTLDFQCILHTTSDCGGGWACLRTRYQETQGRKEQNQNITISKDPDSRSGQDPWSFFLEADYWDVDFSQSTASPSAKGTEFKWKIKCQNGDLNICYIENLYYPGAQIYAHATGGLDTAYRESGDDDSWFRHRIMKPEFSELSQEGESVGETCNYSENDIEAEFSYTEGISVDVSFGMSVGVSISEEVQVGCELASASESISVSWEAEMSTSSTWEESRTVTIKLPVPPMVCMKITRMTGVYGTSSFSPYTIGAHNYNVYQTSANASQKLKYL